MCRVEAEENAFGYSLFSDKEFGLYSSNYLFLQTLFIWILKSFCNDFTCSLAFLKSWWISSFSEYSSLLRFLLSWFVPKNPNQRRDFRLCSSRDRSLIAFFLNFEPASEASESKAVCFKVEETKVLRFLVKTWD